MNILKIFIAVMLMMVAVPLSASAQTALTKEQANNYYLNCKAKRDPRMQEQNQDAMCACTSVMMMKNMSVEDVQLMAHGGNTQESRNALNKMLLDVYAPCMSYPVEDLVATQCLQDPNIDKMGVKMSREDLCGCMAAKTAKWFVTDGRSVMREVLNKNPNITDPIGPIMDSDSFKSKSYDNMISCLTNGG